MKTFYTLFTSKNALKVTLLAALGWLGTAGLQAQITGNFTIDQSAPASASNYQDFQSVIDDLEGNPRSDGGTYLNHYKDGDDDSTAFGITGDATFTVVTGSGPYVWAAADQLTIPAIAGMSSTATVTFDGSGETINYTGTTSAGERAAITLDGADWFRFDDLKIYNVRTGDRNWVIHFTDGADNNIIENCTIRIPNANSSTRTQNNLNAAIVFSASETQFTNNGNNTGSAQGANGRDNIIRNNSIGGREIPGSTGYYGVGYGIAMIGDNTNGTSNNLIQNNSITNFKYYGIYCQYSIDITIDGNDMTKQDVDRQVQWGNAAGIYNNSNEWGAQTDGDMVITNNRIHEGGRTNPAQAQATAWGIYTYNGGDNVEVSNNAVYDFMATGTTWGIYTYTDNYVAASHDVVHNTVSFDGTNYNHNSTIYGLYLQSDASMEVKNNMVSITQSSTSTTSNRVGIYESQWGNGTMNCDYNNVDVRRNNAATMATGDRYGNTQNTNRKDLTVWQTQGYGANSNEEPASFLDVANGDFRSLNFTLNNSGTALGFTEDINDSTRSATNPDPGAFEVEIDANTTVLNWAMLAVCGDFEDSVRITVKNENTFPISGVPVFFQVGSRPIVEEIITASIAPGMSIDYVFATTAVFNDPGAITLQAGIGVSDDDPSNSVKSVVVTVTPSPTGSMLTQDYLGTSPRVNGPIYNLAGNDVTVPGEAAQYEFSAPTANSSSAYAAYGTDWTADAKLFTMGGTDVTATSIASQASAGNAYRVDIDPDVALTDSMLTLMVTMTDVASGCDSTYEKQVLVAPRGIPDFAFPPTICEGEGVLFDNFSTVTTGFLENEWRFKDAGVIIGTAESTNPVFTFPSSGTYEVELVTVSNPHGYRDSVTKTVTVTPIPTVDFVRVNACEGENIVLTNTSSPIGANFTWDFGDGSPTVSTVNATKTYAPGGYAVTLTAEQNGCAASLTKNVYQFARPVANAAVLTGECDNDDFTFQNNSTISVGNTGYLWDFDEPNSVSTASSPTYDFQTPGVKNVRLRAVSEFGCEDTLDMPLVVNVKEAPKAQFTIDQTCSETPSTFTNNSTTPAGATNNYTWTIEGITSTNNNNSFTHNWTALGSQMVTLVATADNGCEDTRMENVEVLIQPKADFLLADVCEGEEVQLTNLTTWPAGDISYSWDMPAATPATSTDGSPTVTINANPGNYNITLTASIAGGCSDVKVIPVEVKPLPETCDFSIDADFANGPNNFDLNPTGGATTGTNYKWVIPYNGTPSTTATGYQDAKFPEGSLEEIEITMSADRNGCGCQVTKTIQLTKTETLPNGGEFKVYPNPTAGKLNVEVSNNTQNLEIAIYNAVGVQVAVVNTSNLTNGTFAVNLDGLAAGLYIVKVKTGSEITTKRITLTK